ncbi:MAG: DNA gyrase subunit A [Bacteroidales bacterium]|nr:DNA gyrase subunit A [Bacteroidales bacterium]
MENEGEKIIHVNIEEAMKSAYIDYSMSVIVSRALPDVRDGLKPVHRRVLFGMAELGVASNKPTKKSARIVGEVLGKYHPHGDSSVYYAMVRLAQPWALRYPLVEGQGNFGSVDGDSPAAMRYTEARLRRLAEEMMADMDKDTIDFQLNFDDTLNEPTVLPCGFPQLLVNGSNGIAVGMATNMAPHNLGETVDAICAYIDNPDITIDELMQHIKGPDFPTGGIIQGYRGIRDAFTTGRGRIVIRSRAEIEMQNDRPVIVITEIPYEVNKQLLIEKIAELVNEKKIDGISFINDESDRRGMRVVIKLKRDANPNVVLNHLYKMTLLQTAFSVNNIALVDGRPRLLNLKELIHYYVRHRHEVIVRRTRFDLKKAQERMHILQGLLIAQDNIDEVVNIIRSSDTPDTAIQRLMERFSLSEIQARAIVDLRLRALTGLERDKLQAEHDELARKITYFNDVLADEGLQMKIVKDELLVIKEKYGDERRTEIVAADDEFDPEDFYADDDMVITISHMGYIKRTPLTEFRAQSRGGIGSKGSSTREEDFLEHILYASMHNTLLLFTKNGKCYWIKVYDLPEGNKSSKGRAIQNVINIEPDDAVQAYINVKTLSNEQYINNHYIVLCTRNGIIKKTSLEKYSRPRQNGINAVGIREGDSLIEAKLTSGNAEVMLAVQSGRAIRFHESNVRDMGRTASGVKAIDVSEEDQVVGMLTVEPNEEKSILVVSENGFGKKSAIDDYRITNRGGKGVKTINITDKTGMLVGIKAVTEDDDLMIINRSGITIRMHVADLRVIGRVAQGVRLINLRPDDAIASIALVPRENGEDDTATVPEAPAEETAPEQTEQTEQTE